MFNRFSDKADILQNKALGLSAKARYHFEKRRINNMALNEKIKFKLAFENLKTREKVLSESKIVFNSVESQFKRGRISANELFIEQDRLLRTQVLTVKSIQRFHESLVDLIHSYGKSLTNSSIL